jgi:hypothetical protein
MSKLWFRAGTYGWGWTPISIEGWIVVAFFVILLLSGTAIFVWQLRAGADTRIASALFILWVAVLSGSITVIAWATGEPPHWRWG